MAITLRLPHTSLLICNIYRAPDAILDLNEIFGLAATDNVIIMGDFNAHHQVLSSPQRANTAGLHLNWALGEFPEILLLNDTTGATHIAAGRLDLTFAS